MTPEEEADRAAAFVDQSRVHAARTGRTLEQVLQAQTILALKDIRNMLALLVLVIFVVGLVAVIQ